MISKRVPIGQYCCERIETISKEYDGLIDYIDISSIDNVEKKIHTYQTIEAKEAPSRAKQLVQKGDILVSTVRPNLNAVAIVESLTENLMVCSTGYCVLRSNGTIDNRFLFYFCQSNYFVDDMTSQATGASYPAVNSGIVKKSLIPIYTLEQQKHISSQLDKVSRLIGFRKQQLSKLDELVKSRFIEMFGDPIINSKNLPEKFFIDVVMLQRGFDLPTQNRVSSGDVPVYGSNGVLDFHDKSRCSNGVITGRSGTIGKVYYCKNDYWPLNTTLFSVDTKGNNIVYLAYLLDYYNLARFYDGTGVPTLNRNVVHKQKIIDVPLDLQNKFATFVEQTDKLKLEVKESLEKLETLKKSLMQKYFG
ncbi:MAG: restriction endonuclease subunit S [Ruminococcus sp.]|nr:restriction endonuclease subunit S [Ruminococcus sp.]